MIVTAEQRPEFFRDASERLGGHFEHVRGHKVIAALHDDGTPAAYAIFTGVGEHKAELSVWSDGQHGMAGRDFLRAVFRTAFVQWRLKRLSAFIAESNDKSQRAARAMGFLPEARLERWFGDEAGFVFFMFPEHCRWLN